MIKSKTNKYYGHLMLIEKDLESPTRYYIANGLKRVVLHEFSESRNCSSSGPHHWVIA